MKPAEFSVGVSLRGPCAALVRVQAEGEDVFLRVERTGPGATGGRVVMAGMMPHEARAIAYALLNAADAARFSGRETAE